MTVLVPITTSGVIALGNLDSQIGVMLSRGSANVNDLTSGVELLLLRSHLRALYAMRNTRAESSMT